MTKNTVKLPDHITGPYGSCVAGRWKNHQSVDIAWTRVIHQLRALNGACYDGYVVRVTGDNLGERLPAPDKRPYGNRSGPSGKALGQQVTVRGTDEQIEALKASAAKCGLSISKYVIKELGLEKRH